MNNRAIPEWNTVDNLPKNDELIIVNSDFPYRPNFGYLNKNKKWYIITHIELPRPHDHDIPTTAEEIRRFGQTLSPPQHLLAIVEPAKKVTHWASLPNFNVSNQNSIPSQPEELTPVIILVNNRKQNIRIGCRFRGAWYTIVSHNFNGGDERLIIQSNIIDWRSLPLFDGKLLDVNL